MVKWSVFNEYGVPSDIGVLNEFEKILCSEINLIDPEKKLPDINVKRNSSNSISFEYQGDIKEVRETIFNPAYEMALKKAKGRLYLIRCET